MPLPAEGTMRTGADPATGTQTAAAFRREVFLGEVESRVFLLLLLDDLLQFQGGALQQGIGLNQVRGKLLHLHLTLCIVLT